jgi:hypothetical protein
VAWGEQKQYDSQHQGKNYELTHRVRSLARSKDRSLPSGKLAFGYFLEIATNHSYRKCSQQGGNHDCHPGKAEAIELSQLMNARARQGQK